MFRGRIDVIAAAHKHDWPKVQQAVKSQTGAAAKRDATHDATVLHWVVNEGHDATVECLLNNGADVKAKDGKFLATPLHWAAAKGHVFVCRRLLMREADANSRDASLRTPLHWAAGNGQRGVIRELLFWGARADCVDSWNKLPLHWAAFRGHVDAVRELVQAASPGPVVRDAEGHAPGEVFHPTVPLELQARTRALLAQGAAGAAGAEAAPRGATAAAELLLETLWACQSWSELFENKFFEELRSECLGHRAALRTQIEGEASSGTAESAVALPALLETVDKLNTALALYDDIRNGKVHVPLDGGAGGAGGSGGNGGGGGGHGASSNQSGSSSHGGRANVYGAGSGGESGSEKEEWDPDVAVAATARAAAVRAARGSTSRSPQRAEDGGDGGSDRARSRSMGGDVNGATEDLLGLSLQAPLTAGRSPSPGARLQGADDGAGGSGDGDGTTRRQRPPSGQRLAPGQHPMDLMGAPRDAAAAGGGGDAGRESPVRNGDGTPAARTPPPAPTQMRLYSLSQLAEACGGFSKSRCIGEGGFGKVYSGSIMGLQVAVKKLDETGLQGREQFFREVEVLSTCRHENIVPLLGVCPEPPCLVYRLMPNNSLRHHLELPERRAALDWRLRARIALDVCRGLSYLHSEGPGKPKVIHRDIKPENILLDESFRARLSDFGISRVGNADIEAATRAANGGGGGGGGPVGGGGGGGPGGGGDGARAALDAQGLQGTFGYMDPQYSETGRLDEGSDIYAMGIVLLELVTGDPVHCPEKDPPSLVLRMKAALDSKQLRDNVDALAGWTAAAAKGMARLGRKCCSRTAPERPTLAEAAARLQDILQEAQSGSVSPVNNQAPTKGRPPPPAGTFATTGGAPGRTEGFDARRDGCFPQQQQAAAGAARAGHAVSNLLAGYEDSDAGYPQRRPVSGSRRGPLVDLSTVAGVPSSSSSSPLAANPLQQQQQQQHWGRAAAVGAAGMAVRPVAPQMVQANGYRIPAMVPGALPNGAGVAVANGVLNSFASNAPSPLVMGAPVLAATPVVLHQQMQVAQQPPQAQMALPPMAVPAVPAPPLPEVEMSVVPLSVYGIPLAEVMAATAVAGPLLASNPRLLCLCRAGIGRAAGAAALSASGQPPQPIQPPLPPLGDALPAPTGHVCLADLWQKSRVVQFPVAAAAGAMSPNRSESVVGLLMHDGGGGRIHVFSIPQRRLLREASLTAAAGPVRMWRWVAPARLALVTDRSVFHWDASKPDPPVKAFDRHATLRPEGISNAASRLCGYDLSADGKWGLLSLVKAPEPAGGGGGSGGDGALSASGSSTVAVVLDLICIERGISFAFKALAGALVTMPASDPPVNLLAMMVVNVIGLPELRVIDVDGSVRQAAAEGPAAVARLRRNEGWLYITTHVFMSKNERLNTLADALAAAQAPAVVAGDSSGGGSGGSSGSAAGKNGAAAAAAVAVGVAAAPVTTQLSPPYFLLRWPGNVHVLFVIGCDGSVGLFDVTSGTECCKIHALTAWRDAAATNGGGGGSDGGSGGGGQRPVVIEAAVDAERAGLVLLSSASHGSITVVSVTSLLRRAYHLQMSGDAEIASRMNLAESVFR